MPLRVLVVDDNPLDLHLLKVLLDNEKHEVETAANGAEALACLAKTHFDVVLTDGIMPMVDGYELCRLVKDDPDTHLVTVIILTGDQNPRNRLWARICGADHFFNKGQDVETLLAVLKRSPRLFPQRVFSDAHLNESRAMNIQTRLAGHLKRNLMETALRNTIAALYEHVHDPEETSWALGRVLADLVMPGAIFVVLPLAKGRQRFVMASADISDSVLAEHLGALGEWAYDSIWCVQTDATLLGNRADLDMHAFLLMDPSGFSYGWWGVIQPKTVLQAHLSLLNIVNEEFQRIYRTLVLLDQVRAVNHRLMQMDQAKTNFLRTVSHEIKNPLSAVQVSLELLANGKVDPASERGTRLLAITMRSISRLARITSSVLDLEKIESGHFDCPLEPVDLSILCEKLLEEYRPLAEERSVSLCHTVHDGADTRVMGNPDRIAQCVINLLSNGLEHSPEQSVLTLALSSNRDGQVKLEIVDQGPGVSPDFQDRIFQPFQQAEKGKGTGLGLLITRALTMHMGGEVGFHNNPSGGATFWLSFPAHVPVPAPRDLA